MRILQEYVPLKMHEVPSGVKVFDWTVPKEWNVKDAYIISPNGRKIAEFKKNNLHLVSYSIPVRKKMSFSELKPHLYSLPNQPDMIPYRTSYYKEDWGFCITHKEFKSLKNGQYEVVIESSLKDGSLTYGEFYIPGKTKKEVLLSCYVCHPSMANDNLSGIAVLTFLAKEMLKSKPWYSYRFLFIPETIGSLVWLSKNRKNVPNIKHGLIATCVGDKGSFTYKKSRRGDAEIDLVTSKILIDSGLAHKIVEFSPSGSDERQFCSPGFNLPFGSLMRTMYYVFPEYHTSGDNLSLVKGEHIFQTIEIYRKVIIALEHNKKYMRTNPFGEPRLDKHNLYNTVGGIKPIDLEKNAMMWVLNFADGKHSLIETAIKAKMDFQTINKAAELLHSHKLLKL